MESFLNSIILIFEVLYYSLFMYFSKREGKLWKYIISFTIITLIIGFLGTNNTATYLVFIMLNLISFKYFVKCNPKLFDVLIMVIMMLFKVLLELCWYLPLHNTFSIYKIGLMYSVVKVNLVLVLKDSLKDIYKKLHKLWNNNNFYIRYIFGISMFIYCIVTCVFIIFYYVGKWGE